MATDTRPEGKVRSFGQNIESDLASRFLRVVETAAIASARTMGHLNLRIAEPDFGEWDAHFCIVPSLTCGAKMPERYRRQVAPRVSKGTLLNWCANAGEYRRLSMLIIEISSARPFRRYHQRTHRTFGRAFLSE